MYYSTLTTALDAIAKRSFSEGATVAPYGVGYRVTDVTDPRSGDYLEDHGDGIEWPSDALDHSREHDPAEFYSDARHIVSNLYTAVETLREHGAVSFHYYAVNTTCTLDLPDKHEAGLCEECEGYGNSITGWALVAYAA